MVNAYNLSNWEGEEDQFVVGSQLCSELGVRLGLKKIQGKKIEKMELLS